MPLSGRFSLEGAKVERIPSRPNGQHVASDMLAYFYNSSAGEDFLYGAAIRRDDCRGLSDSGKRPAALASQRSMLEYQIGNLR
jgi:hypothetical protein